MPWGKNNGGSLVPVLLAPSLYRAFSSDPKPVHSASYAASCSLSPEDSLVTTSVSPAGPWVPLLATCPWKFHFQPHALLLAERSAGVFETPHVLVLGRQPGCPYLVGAGTAPHVISCMTALIACSKGLGRQGK